MKTFQEFVKPPASNMGNETKTSAPAPAPAPASKWEWAPTFTPGPWAFRDDIELQVYSTKGCGLVATVETKGLRAIPDAILISLAPELLAALRLLLSWADNQAAPGTENIEPLRQARAALDKASALQSPQAAAPLPHTRD